MSKTENKTRKEEISLKDQLLIAMPSLDDPSFSQAVVYVCEHNEEGAMGIVINQPLDVRLEELFDQMEIPCEDSALKEQKVLFGGPVQHERGFILHEPPGNWDSSLLISEKNGTTLTTSRDILEAMVVHEGPPHLLICLGYAGWDSGQLEQELTESWLVAPATRQLLFEVPVENRWQAAATAIGINNLNQLSSDIGHA